MFVREASAKDFEALTRLYSGFYVELRSRQGWSPYPLNEYAKELRELMKRDKFFIAEDEEGKAVGFLRVSSREGSYWIEEIYVEPGERGKGYGKSLLVKAEEYVREKDKAIYLMVLPQDTEAIRFWLNAGYSTLNTIELVKYFSQVSHEASMRKMEVFGHLLNMFPWAEEKYSKEEKEFLQVLQDFANAGGSREELLKALTEGIASWLKSKEKFPNYGRIR